MKKIVVIIVIISIVVVAIVYKNLSKPVKYSIMCATFPQYDWVRNIVDTDVELDYLFKTENGLSVSTEDLEALSKCDIFIYDEGIGDFLDGFEFSPKTHIINLSDVCREYILPDNDYTWFSFDIAIKSCEYLITELPLKTTKNFGVYRNKLLRLKDMYSKTIGSAVTNKIIVTDQDPFGYLEEEFGLEVASLSNKQSYEELAKYRLENNLLCACTVDGEDEELAYKLSGSSEVFNLQSMLKATKTDSYLDIMTQNLYVLGDVLNL